MSFLAGLAVGLFVGVPFGFLLACLLISAKWGDEQLMRSRPDSDPYLVSQRMRRAARALERAGITELQGHPRLGIDHVKRGPATLHRPGP